MEQDESRDAVSETMPPTVHQSVRQSSSVVNSPVASQNAPYINAAGSAKVRPYSTTIHTGGE
ncbi:hypothetical protein [Halorussus amylolyticus]|uniref:hypothetical protein n=1 Tax=Halorussus amylolyticus TaxID=1126242 RepID=UPI00138F2D11|nr:hypothetical protein [Halorussus amylolyticus]